jgi:hypothetical protein
MRKFKGGVYMSNEKRYISQALLIIVGILIGSINVMIWYVGDIRFVRDMIPYALVFGMVLFTVTAVIKARCGGPQCMDDDCFHISPTCASVRKYSPLVMIAGAVFIVFSMTVLATYLPYVVRMVLGFIGSISFWKLLPSFITMIACIFRRT